MAQTSTTLYSASAGAGKTYTLARNYLTLLFQNSFNNGYREILAITFTNKAVAEMKERILENLHALTFKDIPQQLYPIRDHIKQNTGLDDESLRIKAKKIQQKLLHDYASFDIVTIDSFNHRILRTFAREVQLPDGFDIELDSNRLISKAIHNLLVRAGNDKRLTKLLVEFSISKIDEGKSWDIEYDLHAIAELIKSESHYNYLQQIKKQSIEQFLKLRTTLKERLKGSEESLLSQGKKLFDSYNEQGLTVADFKGKTKGIYMWIKKFADGTIPSLTRPAYLKTAMTSSISGTTSSSNVAIIDSLQGDLVALIQNYEDRMSSLMLYKNALSKITALSLLNELVKEIGTIKTEERIVPIYEFNGILSKEIKNQPAPFIYERLGERYRHYFIDEFQDTSTMQWENLMPLIENPLVQLRDDGSKGSLMLVGDAKQSIYRWRGGDADQFLDILSNSTLFNLEKSNETLGTNWRSYDQIINFNNAFFQLYGQQLDHDVYQDLYLNYLHQQTTNKTGGYIQIDFLNSEDDRLENEENTLLNSNYPIHVKSQIDTAINNGFAPHEICVLVRKKKQGDEIAQYLVQHDYNVVSSDSLLVAASPRVQLLVQFMRMCLYPEQQEPRYHFLLQYALLHEILEIHGFISTHLHLDLSQLCRQLLNDKDRMDIAFAKAPLFQATEQVAAALGLFEHHDMRLQAFMEYVFEMGSSYEKTAASFMDQWEVKQDALSVPAAEDPTAIQIMTIHKSKGLEFPVVIVPYCDELLENPKDITGWLPVNQQDYEGFEHLYISLKKECVDYPEPAPTMYREQLAKSQMDQINTLYVAFTRAKEQLYVSCIENEKTKNNYSQLLHDFVDNNDWPLEEHEFYKSFKNGDAARVSTRSTIESSQLMDRYYVSSRENRASIATSKGMLWASDSIDAINKGTQLHYYLSLIEDSNSFTKVAKAISLDRSLSKEIQEEFVATIDQLIHHKDLSIYYAPGVEVVNERAILTAKGRFVPDRLVFDGKNIIIIDYKTGAERSSHKEQVNQYDLLLTEMDYQVTQKILVYTDDLKILSWK